jgi:hypothetical protein
MKIIDIIEDKTYNEYLESLINVTNIKLTPIPLQVEESIFKKNLDSCGLNHEYIIDLIRIEQHSLLKYSINKIKSIEKVDDNEEYPKGKKPKKDEKSLTKAVLGYPRGFLIGDICEFHFLKDNNIAGLENYLNKLKTPGVKQQIKYLQENVYRP